MFHECWNISMKTEGAQLNFFHIENNSNLFISTKCSSHKSCHRTNVNPVHDPSLNFIGRGIKLYDFTHQLQRTTDRQREKSVPPRTLVSQTWLGSWKMGRRRQQLFWRWIRPASEFASHTCQPYITLISPNLPLVSYVVLFTSILTADYFVYL
jgi:hypothetical protein